MLLFPVDFEDESGAPATEEEDKPAATVDNTTSFKSPDQLSDELVTLSLLPQSRWRHLTSLELIKVTRLFCEPQMKPFNDTNTQLLLFSLHPLCNMEFTNFINQEIYEFTYRKETNQKSRPRPLKLLRSFCPPPKNWFPSSFPPRTNNRMTRWGLPVNTWFIFMPTRAFFEWITYS